MTSRAAALAVSFFVSAVAGAHAEADWVHELMRKAGLEDLGAEGTLTTWDGRAPRTESIDGRAFFAAAKGAFLDAPRPIPVLGAGDAQAASLAGIPGCVTLEVVAFYFEGSSNFGPPRVLAPSPFDLCREPATVMTATTGGALCARATVWVVAPGTVPLAPPGSWNCDDGIVSIAGSGLFRRYSWGGLVLDQFQGSEGTLDCALCVRSG